jgi:hypothetical protein
MSKLNEIVAARTGVQSRSDKELMELHKKEQKADLFSGISRVFKPIRETDDSGAAAFVYPPESKIVQLTVADVLTEASKLITDIIDLNASNEEGNCVAKADVEVDGKKILTGVPVSMLLFLEKRMKDFRDVFDHLPTIDPAEVWNVDGNTGMYRTAPADTHKTKKVPKVIVLAPATKEHPAQAQLAHEDIIEGVWETTKFSGAIPATVKKGYLERVDQIITALKKARERANSIDVPERKVAKPILDFVLNGASKSA